VSSDSNGSEWEAVFHDFPEADPYMVDSEFEQLLPGSPAELLGEIGVYREEANNLSFEVKYVDSKWESRNWSFADSRNTFTGPKVGPTSFYGRRIPEVHSFFSQFWPTTTLAEIVKQTNLYASQPVHGAQGQQRRVVNGGANWKKLTVKALKAWLGIVIYLGLKTEPALKDYWSLDTFFGCPIVRNIMSRDRFLSILRNIHLVDNSNLYTNRRDPQFDKLAKVRWLVDNFVVARNF